jgi:hypothetical protein
MQNGEIAMARILLDAAEDIEDRALFAFEAPAGNSRRETLACR